MKKKSRTDPKPQISVRVTVLCDRNAAVAVADAYHIVNGIAVHERATGSAKRERDDVRDDVLATQLATGRALVNLGRSLQGTARVLIEDAAHRQEHERIRRVRNQLRAIRPKRPPAPPLSLLEVYSVHGPEAATVTAARRGQERLLEVITNAASREDDALLDTIAAALGRGDEELLATIVQADLPEHHGKHEKAEP